MNLIKGLVILNLISNNCSHCEFDLGTNNCEFDLGTSNCEFDQATVVTVNLIKGLVIVNSF